MYKKQYSIVFKDSKIEYDNFIPNEKKIINKFCRLYKNKQSNISTNLNNNIDIDIDVDIMFKGMSYDSIISLLNKTPLLNNETFKNLLYNKIIYDINNDNIELFAKKYNLDLDSNPNVIGIINYCYNK